MKYDKIIRDLIPHILKDKGIEVKSIKVNSKDSVEYLVKKVSEELEEFKENYEIDELGDIFEVLYGIMFHLGVNRSDLDEIINKKRLEKGGFENGTVLLETIEPGEESQGVVKFKTLEITDEEGEMIIETIRLDTLSNEELFNLMANIGSNQRVELWEREYDEDEGCYLKIRMGQDMISMFSPKADNGE